MSWQVTLQALKLRLPHLHQCFYLHVIWYLAFPNQMKHVQPN